MYKFNSDSIFLVTGGAGFIGSNLVEKILELGYKVVCLDDLSTGSKDNIESFISNENFTFIEGSITDYNTCLKATKNVDYVLHHAAWGSVPRSIEIPLTYQKINVQGTLNMLEASRENKIKKFVYASSSSVYGDTPNLPKKEGEEGEVLSPYALTKRINEEYARLYKKIYDLDTYGLRYFNVYGKRQNPDGVYAAVIPKFINTLLINESPIIYGDGFQSRDFTYVENVIDANLKTCLADSKFAGEAYNIGTGDQEYLNDVFIKISKKLNKKIPPIYLPNRKGDIRHSNADINKAINKLKYSPKIKFEEGIELTIKWYIDKL